MPSAEQQLFVGPSRIAGHGLFTAVPLRAETAVVRLDGADVRERLNHSCEPNLGFANANSLLAVRDIAAGAELTLDYATAIADPDFVLMCHCETYRCRQVIEGTDWKIPQLQQRYAGRWAPSVQHLIDQFWRPAAT